VDSDQLSAVSVQEKRQKRIPKVPTVAKASAFVLTSTRYDGVPKGEESKKDYGLSALRPYF
jgi:hypothetical protein